MPVKVPYEEKVLSKDGLVERTFSQDWLVGPVVYVQENLSYLSCDLEYPEIVLDDENSGTYTIQGYINENNQNE